VGLQDAKIASELRILYGGSVKAAMPASVHHARRRRRLIGGASLKSDEFLAIVAAAA
jgi:triosephosphate isomerase